MRLVILGAGYVGLVSAACFAALGHDVTLQDTDPAKITALQSGIMPLYEPGLAALVRETVQAGRLHFTTTLDEALANAAIVFITVGTPSRRGDGHADLAFVKTAAQDIATRLPPDRCIAVVLKSTVPVGTGSRIAALMRTTNPQAHFVLCANPEFLREGAALADFMHPDRIVVGTETPDALALLQELYQPLIAQGAAFVPTTLESAEVAKYASNAFLATKIAFINEMADFCSASGADIRAVARIMGLDGRIGAQFLQAGPGFGGSCFPKDTLALARSAQEHGVALTIVDSVITSNRQRKQGLASRIIKACGGQVADTTIAILGLTFKAETDDLRESPALEVIPALQTAGAVIQAYDPIGMVSAQPHLPDVQFMASAEAALTGCDAAVILTEWDVFRGLDMARLEQIMRQPRLIDFRNLYDAAEMSAQGIEYYGLGVK